MLAGRQCRQLGVTWRQFAMVELPLILQIHMRVLHYIQFPIVSIFLHNISAD